MTEVEFQELLATRKVVIVHFSHFAVMGHYVEFPDDLMHAITHYETETRSCCALWPGHALELPGSVGLILRPCLDQVVSVLADDSGSSDFGGKEISAGQLPTMATILDSLEVYRGGYNEWRVRGAKPVGVFVADPADIQVKRKKRLSVGDRFVEEIGCNSVTLQFVARSFPQYSIYTFDDGDLRQVSAVASDES